MSLKKISMSLFAAAGFVILCGIVSYSMATGIAVIGPSPASLADQRASIVASTLWWAVSFLIIGAIARIGAPDRSSK